MNILMKTHGVATKDPRAEIAALRREAHLLAEQGALLQMTLDHVSEGVLTLDRDWLIGASNDAVDRLLDLPLDLVLTGTPFCNVLSWLARRGDYGAGDPTLIAASLIADIERHPHWRDERETADGRVICWRIRDMPGRGRIVTISDVTDRRDAAWRHAGRRSARRFEPVSGFAGGLAHDVNAGLLPILGLTELAMAEMSEGSGDSDRVLSAAEHARTLVRRLLDVSRSRQEDGAETDVQDSVIRAVDLIRPTLNANIILRMDLQGRDRRVALGPTEVQQIVTNLTLNAVQAIGDRPGIVVIQTAEVEDDDPRLRSNRGYDPTRDYIRISVIDDGPGIPDAILPRIFEPFFTTREIGKGSGLGLAVVHGLVTQAGGWVEAIGSTGARFDVFLPAN